jgi:hypothetical protein
MELVGWTNDRLVAERIARLPENEWVYGVPNASIVMAAFLHVAPGGMRFNGPAGCRRDFGWNLLARVSGTLRVPDQAARSIG